MIFHYNIFDEIKYSVSWYSSFSWAEFGFHFLLNKHHWTVVCTAAPSAPGSAWLEICMQVKLCWLQEFSQWIQLMYFILTNFIHVKVCYLIEVSAIISEDCDAPLESNLSYHNVEVSEISWVPTVFLCIHSVWRTSRGLVSSEQPHWNDWS